MAILKILSSGTTDQSMKNCIRYVLNEEKTDGCISFVGPINDTEINTKTVADAFIQERKNWGKMQGRTYLHSVLSFSGQEKITPKEALEVAEKLVSENPFYDKYQCLLAVHQDRDHIHCHIVQNPVSYLDGSREHHNTADLNQLISDTNELCVSMGYMPMKAGYHADGSKIEEGTIISSDTKKYRVLMDTEKHSYIVECMVAVEACRHVATSKEDFVKRLQQHGWDTKWSDERKYITFSDGTHRFRNSNLSKTFNMDLSKEALLNEFEATARGEYIESNRIDAEATGSIGFASTAGNNIGSKIIAVGAKTASTGVQRIAAKSNNEERKRSQKKGTHL